ncbi:phytanoyl-CoA dioxygenase family protein [Oceanospirillaceae bacterium]|nr:phytanoyl-CoA dioxygenase family protein [Oceanospirillaceae bacterium]MDB9752725.1 phytanoyl-CoA dioxygenase family protein [Oceanospirillaceae bacterium]
MLFKPTDDNQQSYREQGYLVVDKILPPDQLPPLHQAFDDIYHGIFETGVTPDEVNWQHGTGDPSLTRQICNGWKANRSIACVVLNEDLARSIAQLAGWSGIRIMIDNLLSKPPGARALGYHQDSSYLSWFTPSDLISCWIALDDTTQVGGTLEFATHSHQWQKGVPVGEFHGPDDYQKPMQLAAKHEGVQPHIKYVQVKAGGGSLHHGWTWHGSGANESAIPRRALVLHLMRSDAAYDPDQLAQGIGPIYSRYKHLADNQLDENHFPILWHENGTRTQAIDDYLNPPKAT